MNGLKERLTYTGVPLDRAAARRTDPEWVRGAIEHDEARFLPLWRNRNLVRVADRPHPAEAVALPRAQADWLIDAAAELVLLGLEGDSPVFAADLTAYEEAQLDRLAGAGEFVDLRKIGPLLAPDQAALLAYARGLLYWHRHHGFCARCGSPTVSGDGGHSRGCVNPDCGKRTFPRIDPAVIMLVEHRPEDGSPARCLLGRHTRLPAGMFSTLAGFVEAGESLEEAVVREVREEVGIEVEEVRYQGSQPWPFPASIMLGFRARALSTEIRVDDEELDEAHWFTAEEVRSFGEWWDGRSQRSIPRADSIARYLIESWVAEVGGESRSES